MSESDSVTEYAPTPDDVMEKFKQILAGAVDGTTVIVKARVRVGGPFHYMIARANEDGTAILPMAIIPESGTILQYLLRYDQIMLVHGGPESDPDFKGVRQ